jgi:beta-N-acetylhexosaminidase
MSNEELLGQLFIITYAGEKPDADFLYWVRERKIGGVKIFGWNADNLVKLIQSITVLSQRLQKHLVASPFS